MRILPEFGCVSVSVCVTVCVSVVFLSEQVEGCVVVRKGWERSCEEGSPFVPIKQWQMHE